jgi:hypothetical protein
MKDPAKEPWYYGVFGTILWIVPVLGTLILLFVPELRKKKPALWWASLAITVCFFIWLGYVVFTSH